MKSSSLNPTNSASAALPLPMTPFEEYMLGDDRPAYPMSFFVRLRFTGSIDRDSFQQALRTALRPHCLLWAKLQNVAGARKCWTDASDSQLPVRWLDKDDDESYPPIATFDLERCPGFSVAVLSNSGTSDMVLQFHHAVCDGQGAFGFINDMLIAYAMQRGEQVDSVSLKPLDALRLAQRGHFDLSWRRILKMLPKQAVGLLGVRQFLMRRPASLSGSKPVDLNKPPPPGFPRVAVLRLEPKVLASIRETARQQNVTPNQLYTSDLFLAINDWRSKSVDCGDDWIRFSVPISLRTEKDQTLSAANKVSMVFLDRRGEHFTAPSELLRGIRDETQLIARNQLEFTFLFSLWFTRRMRGDASAGARTDRCQATTLLSNVGAPFARSPLVGPSGKLAVADLTLEALDIVGPLRPYTEVAFSVCEYAGSLHITLHWDERAITASQARELLDAYEQRLRNSSY